MKQMRIMVIILQVLLLLSANAWARVPVNTDERFVFLGESKDFYYFGWAGDTNYQKDNKQLWIKIIPEDLGRELLDGQGCFPDAVVTAKQEIDSILCRVDVAEEEGVKVMQVAEQYYYDQSGTVIAHGIRSEWSGRMEQSVSKFIVDKCNSFLTAYFNFK